MKTEIIEKIKKYKKLPFYFGYVNYEMPENIKEELLSFCSITDFTRCIKYDIRTHILYHYIFDNFKDFKEKYKIEKYTLQENSKKWIENAVEYIEKNFEDNSYKLKINSCLINCFFPKGYLRPHVDTNEKRAVIFSWPIYPDEENFSPLELIDIQNIDEKEMYNEFDTYEDFEKNIFKNIKSKYYKKFYYKNGGLYFNSRNWHHVINNNYLRLNFQLSFDYYKI